LAEHEDAWMGIISRRPPWVVRWGISLFFVMVCVLLGISWFIRYPDRVSARGKLLAQYPPQPLLARTDGRLLHLLQQEGDTLQTGDLIAVLQSTTDYLSALNQKAIADSFLLWVTTGRSYQIAALYNQSSGLLAPSQLGELQSGYQLFFAALQTYVQYLGNGYYIRQRQLLQNDLSNLAAQQRVIAEQLDLTLQEVKLAGENFKVSETLSKQSVIAPVEYRNEAGKWLGKQLQMPQLKNVQLANAAQRLEKLKQIDALENDIVQQKAIFVQALQNWRSAIAAWEQQYMVYAPCNGRLVLSSFYNPGRNLQRGEMLGNVQPDNAGYFMEATLPQYNFGKLQTGQQAIVRFDAFPYEEFGQVAGSLAQIKPIPTDSGYLATLTLPQGLTTHLGKSLKYREGLQGSIEIITDNRRLTDRFLSGIRKAVQR
jgi:HlyD family secretion protein